MKEDKWINRTALISAIMQDVQPFMEIDTLCDRNLQLPMMTTTVPN
jgi:isochorismate hydrolase